MMSVRPQVGRPLLRVRHASDPHITAVNLTHSQLLFGLHDGVKAMGGLELLVCAAALSSPAIFFFARRWRYGVYSHLHQDFGETEFSRVLQVSRTE